MVHTYEVPRASVHDIIGAKKLMTVHLGGAADIQTLNGLNKEGISIYTTTIGGLLDNFLVLSGLSSQSTQLLLTCELGQKRSLKLKQIGVENGAPIALSKGERRSNRIQGMSIDTFALAVDQGTIVNGRLRIPNYDLPVTAVCAISGEQGILGMIRDMPSRIQALKERSKTNNLSLEFIEVVGSTQELNQRLGSE